MGYFLLKLIRTLEIRKIIANHNSFSTHMTSQYCIKGDARTNPGYLLSLHFYPHWSELAAVRLYLTSGSGTLSSRTLGA